ncbi:hypothetical protein WQ54_09635 [Bacillus sp. SA1-12]|uniref:hypothetical protein n=1 Tax=Bacillus sp. SA1-12 TaxID=1455638 RepID=UPI000626B90F|nr:hypothetical protein [Bacillus sp. SA1-12]KKI92421.1 hypothetical protein WQ54_09635 [Bacillus sp. SA1-12]
MTFRDEAKNCYEQSMRNYGISEQTIRIALWAFDTGFSAGVLNDSNRQAQFEMLKKLLNQNVIN